MWNLRYVSSTAGTRHRVLDVISSIVIFTSNSLGSGAQIYSLSLRGRMNKLSVTNIVLVIFI